MKRLLIFAIVLITLVQADVTFTTPYQNINLGPVEIDSGFYGAQAGNIDFEVVYAGAGSGSPMNIEAEIMGPMVNAEGYRLPENNLDWKIYYLEIDGVQTPVQTSWTPYRPGIGNNVWHTAKDVRKVKLQLGTQLRRIPAVQPQGIYETHIRFTVTE